MAEKGCLCIHDIQERNLHPALFLLRHGLRGYTCPELQACTKIPCGLLALGSRGRGLAHTGLVVTSQELTVAHGSHLPSSP